jgi:hypothetical protein
MDRRGFGAKLWNQVRGSEAACAVTIIVKYFVLQRTLSGIPARPKQPDDDARLKPCSSTKIQ